MQSTFGYVPPRSPLVEELRHVAKQQQQELMQSDGQGGGKDESKEGGRAGSRRRNGMPRERGGMLMAHAMQANAAEAAAASGRRTSASAPPPQLPPSAPSSKSNLKNFVSSQATVHNSLTASLSASINATSNQLRAGGALKDGSEFEMVQSHEWRWRYLNGRDMLPRFTDPHEQADQLRNPPTADPYPIVMSVRKLISEQWPEIQFTVRCEEASHQMILKFPFHLHQQCLLTYMNTLANHSELLHRHCLRRDTGNWGVDGGDGFLYFTLLFPWSQDKQDVNLRPLEFLDNGFAKLSTA